MAEEDIREAVAAAAGRSAPGEALDRKLAHLGQDDLGNGQRMRERFGKDLIFVDEMGWLSWKGSHWSIRDGHAAAELAAQKTAELIAAEAEAEQLAAAANEEGASETRAGYLREWGHDSRMMPRINAMQSAARPHMRLDAAQLDADLFRFTAANVTLSLGKDDIRVKRHARRDFMTHASPVAYDPDASAPEWEKFLARIQPSKAMRVALQKWFGYQLTGDISEQVFMILQGGGQDGKSTLVDAIRWVLGDYALTMRAQSLMEDDRARGSEATPDLAMLPGKRGVFASEPKKGKRLNEGLIKELTGSEPMTVRQLNKPFITFMPAGKLTISCNSLPLIGDQSRGMWRRVRVAPFTEFITDDERDKHFGDRLRKEGPGILNWLLDGYRMWREEGLVFPEAMELAADQYRGVSGDNVREFISAAVELDTGARVLAGALWGCYVRWCRANGADSVSNTRFGRTLVEMGFEKEKLGIISYRGLRLKADLPWMKEREEPPDP